MAFVKGAFSRHILRRAKRSGRVKQWGSRRRYRRARKAGMAAS